VRRWARAKPSRVLLGAPLSLNSTLMGKFRQDDAVANSEEAPPSERGASG
jgi:hypothetical protein